MVGDITSNRLNCSHVSGRACHLNIDRKLDF